MELKAIEKRHAERDVLPALLAALKEIELSARSHGGGFLMKSDLLVVVRRHGEIARAALAKARGE